MWKEQRKAYWKYIENITFDLPIKDSDQSISTRILNQKSFLATSKALERTTRA
jgi:hypothetical protein